MAKKKTAGTRGARARRGKGEDMTEAKASAVEVRTGFGQGDLKLPAPDDAEHHKKSILGALDKKRTADAFYKNCLKKAQAAGIDTDMLLEANNIVRKNDPKAMAAKLNQLAFFLNMEGFPLSITVQDTLVEEHLDSIYRRYYADGKAGKTLENPYPLNSQPFLQAARAWRHGTASNMGLSVADADKALDEDELEQLSSLPPAPDMAQAAVH